MHGESLYLNSPAWRGVISSAEYAHFDEWWGPFHYTRGWETMGDVLSRLAEVDGKVIMSKVMLPTTLLSPRACHHALATTLRHALLCGPWKGHPTSPRHLPFTPSHLHTIPPLQGQTTSPRASPCRAYHRKVKLPFAEAKSCRDVSCMFCPCGALRMRLGASRGRLLVVNELEVMLLHIAESKYAWFHAPALSLPSFTRGSPFYHGCVGVRGLGFMNSSCGPTCTSRAPIFTDFGQPGAVRAATRLTRHRVQTKWAGHIKYATAPGEIRLKVDHCEGRAVRRPAGARHLR